MRCGVTKRSIDTAASGPASAAVTPVMPDAVSISTSVTKNERWISPRPQAGRKSAGSGRSSTRERTRVIRVSVRLTTATAAILSGDNAGVGRALGDAFSWTVTALFGAITLLL